MAIEFVYTQPVKIWFGEGITGKLPEILSVIGSRRCVLVCGRHMRETAEKWKSENPAIAEVFSEVEPNPQLAGAEQAAVLARQCGADTLIGCGGGSAMDTAKFAAAIAPGNRPAEDYYRGLCEFPATPLKIVEIPTTAGTGSEVTRVSVISCGKEKRTINHPAFMPTAAVVDPELTLSVSPRTTMNTGLDAMAHALEGYWSKNHQPLSDLMAIECVRLVLQNLEKAFRNGADREARSGMAYAALLGGLSFALPKTAGCHACSYPLSEDYHLPHGEACAFTLDSFVRINTDDRLTDLAKAAGLPDTDSLAARIKELKELAGLRTRLSELGEVDLGKLCSDCAKHPLMANNPVKLDEAMLREMFERLS